MSDFFSSIFLGVVQGLGEFIPVSSSGHLILARYVFNLDLNFSPAQYLAFDVALHLGTLCAVVLYFRRKIKKTILSHTRDQRKKLISLLILTTLPGAIAGVVFSDLIEEIFRSPASVASMIFFYGLLLLAADLHYRNQKKETAELAFPLDEKIHELPCYKAFIIGMFQALALIPGTSRSGATITGGLFLGLDRKDAAKLSFFISIPIIFGAGLIQVPALIDSGLNPRVFVTGFFVSFLVGFLSIKFMLRYLAARSYVLFVAYRIILALIIFGIIACRG
ncbi:MAG: undecaprenyl-diphosphate phosphatase [Patescibacteria group bacterium]|nr:undecaprenyl-diphosphate phosphatase [Patescibacteria group bacterium]